MILGSLQVLTSILAPSTIEDLEFGSPVMNPKLPQPQALEVDVNIELVKCGVCDEMELTSEDEIEETPIGKFELDSM